MMTASLSRWGIAAVILGGLCALAGPAAAKSYPKTKKSCSHQKVSVTITSNQSLAYQKAVQAWTSQTGANINIAQEKQFSCQPTTSQPHSVTCTLTARPCYIKKIFYPTLQPEMERLGPPPGYTTQGSNSFALTPRGSFGGGGVSPGIRLQGRR